MSKRRIILVSVVCFSIAVLTVQTLSQTSSSNQTIKPRDAERLRNMTGEERKKELEKLRVQRKLERERRRKELEEERWRWELGSEQRRLDREQKRKEAQERRAKIKKEFLYEKYALKPTEERWKLIKPKLEKVRQLSKQARSTIGASLAGSSSGGAGARPNAPIWQWKRPWKDKAPSELTEAQRIAKELVALVERKNTTPEAFRRKMAALRKARSEEAELKRQLTEARRELREVLTTRQEAALVLMYWL